MATPAFRLDPPVKNIIHTVGPIWEGGDYDEPAILASCYRRSLEIADSLNARTVAFPAIATGNYGFPADQAASIAIETIRTHRPGSRSSAWSLSTTKITSYCSPLSTRSIRSAERRRHNPDLCWLHSAPNNPRVPRATPGGQRGTRWGRMFSGSSYVSLSQ